MKSSELIKNIILNGSPEEKKQLFTFNSSTPDKKVLLKCKLFLRTMFPRYFQEKPADFHDGMMLRTIQSYRGQDVNEIGYRGSAKTTLKKLVRVYLILNDEDHYRRYMKVLSREEANAVQIVTDIYNMILECEHIYGDVFETKGKKKTEERMGSFTLDCGVKLTAGTVGKKQRGHLQDAYRPDWVWFEDIEDVDSIASQTITTAVIKRCDEAINGFSKNGSYELTGNYISDSGSVQWFINKQTSITEITPIAKELDIKNGKVVHFVPSWDDTVEKIQKLYKDSLDFWGEYMCDPNRSDNKVFDIARIEADMKLCTEPTHTSGEVKYWSTYKPHHRYGQGSDHSEGIGRDANTLVGFDFTTGEQIYSYANNEIAPDLSAYEFARVGSEFGNCIYAPEINNKCGGIVIQTLKSIPYPKIYEQIKEEKYEVNNTKKLGWETNGKTKYTAFFDFKRDYNDGLIKIHDIEILKEMKAYTNNDLAEDKGGLATRHFDLLMATVIAWQMNRHASPTYREEYEEEEYEPLYPGIGI